MASILLYGQETTSTQMQSYSLFPDRLAGLKGGGGGAMGALASPHRDQRSIFLLISDLKQSEVGVLLYNSIYWLCSKIENAVKKATSLTHSFHKMCFSLCKV